MLRRPLIIGIKLLGTLLFLLGLPAMHGLDDLVRQKAEKLIRDNRDEEAADTLILADPAGSDPASLVLLADILYRKGSFDYTLNVWKLARKDSAALPYPVETILRTLVRSIPQAPDIWLALANLLWKRLQNGMETGQTRSMMLQDTIEAYEKSLYTEIGTTQSYERLGLLYLEQDDAERSITFFEAGLKKQSDHVGLHYQLAYALFMLSRYQEALPHVQFVYESAVKSPNHRNARLLFGEILLGLSRYSDAEALFRAAAEAEPDNPFLLRKIFECTVNNQNWKKATTSFRQYLEKSHSVLDAVQKIQALVVRNAAQAAIGTMLTQTRRWYQQNQTNLVLGVLWLEIEWLSAQNRLSEIAPLRAEAIQTLHLLSEHDPVRSLFENGK